MRITGHYERLGSLDSFIPSPLPPSNPPLQLDEKTMALYGDAMHQLGKLNGMANKLPDSNRFIRAYITKEALLSSEIEGINTTLLDVFTQQLLESKPSKETQLVMNYTKALDEAVSLITIEGLPVSIRVIRAAHKKLMQTGEADPGNFRKQSVRVGNLIPPPATKVPELMADLERYINTDESLPPLINAGLAHVQFETIHPFLDGNGRIGRLLIVLILLQADLLNEPILYPSYYFKKYHAEYYRHLDRVRTQGDFEGWITFYLKAIRGSCADACRRMEEIEELRMQLMQKIDRFIWPDAIVLNDKRRIKMHENRIAALSIIFMVPVINKNELSKQLDISFNTASQIIKEFVDHGILVEITHQKRSNLYTFKSYLDVLERKYPD